jgi:hypothetical protein
MRYDYKDLLINTAESMQDLANKLDTNFGTEPLDRHDKELLKLATFGLMKDIMKEMEMFYMTGNRKDLFTSLDDLNQLFKETL